MRQAIRNLIHDGLAVNLVHDIVTGKRTVEVARKEFAEQTAAWTMNRPAPYTEGVCFPQPPEAQTGYLDEGMLKKAAAHQTVEKVKDVLGIGQ